MNAIQKLLGRPGGKAGAVSAGAVSKVYRA